MKNKLLKKISILSLTSVVSLLLAASHIQAAEVCTTYHNYYFFNEINKFADVDPDQNDNATTKYIADGDNWIRSHRTYFPALPSGYTNKSSGEKICLRKGENVEGDCSEEYTWDLETFYNMRKKITIPGETFEIPQGETSYSYFTEEKNGEVYTYYAHKLWYEIQGNTVGNSGIEGVDYTEIDTETLVKGSILPEMTSVVIDFDSASGGIGFARIDRTINKDLNTNEKFDDITAFKIAWTNGTEYDSVLTPSLYHISYQLCEDVPVYNATINYYYIENGEKTTKRVEFDNNEPNPYVETGLEDGYTNEVVSPKLENCTADKDVTIKIEGEDFVDNVYYTCKTETLKDNPETGSVLIFTAWTVGIGALGYSAYYFSKMRKEKKEGTDEE